jgi:hypothetical protein
MALAEIVAARYIREDRDAARILAHQARLLDM